jgi:hypothetical protein
VSLASSLCPRYTDKEWVVFAIWLSFAVVLAARWRYPMGSTVPLDKLLPMGEGSEALDLPCPWCTAPTVDGDATCPSCGHRFG